jgi:hypothetical protein
MAPEADMFGNVQSERGLEWRGRSGASNRTQVAEPWSFRNRSFDIPVHFYRRIHYVAYVEQRLKGSDFSHADLEGNRIAKPSAA